MYTSSYVARLFSAPSGDLFVNPSVFLGAAVSSERSIQCPTGTVVGMGGSHPRRRLLEQTNQTVSAGHPLQSTELAAYTTPETSFERLVSLDLDFSVSSSSTGHLCPQSCPAVTQRRSQSVCALEASKFSIFNVFLQC